MKTISHFKNVSLGLVVGAVLVLPGMSAYADNLTLTPSSVSLALNQPTIVAISGGSGAYFISGNTSPSSVQASTGGSSLNLTLIGGGASGSVTVCDGANTTLCATITVTNSGGGTSSNGPTFNPTSVSLPLSGNQSVIISGSGNYYVSSNSNPSVVSLTLNGSTLSMTGTSAGTTNISVCQAAGGCSTLVVTIGGSTSNTTTNTSANTNGPSLNPSSLTLNVGATQTVGVSGSTGVYFISNNSQGGVATASLNNGTITVTGIGAGTTTVTVCQSGGCNDLTVTVNGTGTTTNTNTTTSNTNTTTNTAGTTTNTVITTPNVSGLSSAIVSTLLSQIQSMKTQISQLTLQLTQLETAIRSLGTVSTLSTSVNMSINSGYKFYNPLAYGDSGSDVTELQKRLIVEGFLTGEPTGYFGSLTEQAVKKYQSAHGLSPLGSVGPGTRAELNK